ncbi:MAG: 50S ribosomal protein L24 [Bacilli bacterium]|nr:50S ribosomal protein L24 [Bacilli bacterium]
MKLRKGDSVVVVYGKDKGKQGVIQRAFPHVNKVVIEGVNLRKKHVKPNQSNSEGQIVQIYAPIDASNVMLLDPKSKKPTRVGFKVVNGKKVRYAKDSGTVLE